MRSEELPPNIALQEGKIDHDGWMSPSVTFAVVPPNGRDTLAIALWNPDFAPSMEDNRLRVTCGEEVGAVGGIALDQTVVVTVSVVGATSLRLTSEKRLENWGPRPCGFQLVGCRWL